MPVEMITERTGYIPGGVNIGMLVGSNGSIAMIDTGLNETNAKKALKAIEALGHGPVTRVLTTHAHADHFGGNATIVKRTGADVWAPPIDEAIIRNPLLQPSLLFAGADPPAQLRGGFLLAEPSPVDRIIDEARMAFEGLTIDVVPLQGHSPGQVGFLVDDVFFCADVILPRSVLDKYRIPYLYAVGDHLQSLDRALTVACQRVVPGHGPLLASLDDAASDNRRLVENVADFVLQTLTVAMSAEHVFLKVLEEWEAPVADAAAYYLLHPTIHAFLSYLSGIGEVEGFVEGRRMLWRRTDG